MVNKQLYHKPSKFKRSEDYGNTSCECTWEKGVPVFVRKRAFILLSHALDDVVTGLLDLLGIEYAKDSPLSHKMRLLEQHAPDFTDICVSRLLPHEYDTISDGVYLPQWVEAREVHKELIHYAANFCGESGEANDEGGSGQYVSKLLRLLERYSEPDIIKALYCPSDDEYLKPLFDWPDKQKKKALKLLRFRMK